MLIAECKPPKIDKRRFPPKSCEIELGAHCPELTIRQITPHLIGCYSVPPHDDAHIGGYFVIMTIRSNRHFLSDSKYYNFSSNGVLLSPGTLTIIHADTLHWLYQEPGFGQTFLRRSYWVGLCWNATKRQLKSLVRGIVSQYEGEWTPNSADKRYSLLFPDEAF
jgi:hypothetical protein